MNKNKTISHSLIPGFLSFSHRNYAIFPAHNYRIINDIQFLDIKFCPICLESKKAFFCPNTCEHFFCRKCLILWSKTKKICPLCRAPFANILKKH